MRKDFKGIAARDGDQRQPGRFACTDRERRRRRHGDDNRHTHRCGFLHHLNRDPAAENKKSAL
jgi:hypothetical protein